MSSKRFVAAACVATAISLTGCAGGADKSQTATDSTDKAAVKQLDTKSASTATSGAEAGVEKVKPAPGTGNVQGKVLFNGKPVGNIEVKLCESFNRFFGGCSGKSYTARTDEGGEYVITNVEPKTYEGLLARVFETDSYIFAATGIGGLSAAKYDIAADKTLFVAPTNLFKSDLKLLNPKAGAKVSAQNLELKWDAYPDAAYYKFSIYAEEAGVTSPYINERVEATSFGLDKPMPKGTYRWQVTAYNDSDQKLSESDNNIKFTITDGTAP